MTVGCASNDEDDLATDGFDASIKGDASTEVTTNDLCNRSLSSDLGGYACTPPTPPQRPCHGLSRRGYLLSRRGPFESSVLASPRVDVGALNDGVGTLISVNDAASTVDGTLTSDAGSSTIGKPFTNNVDGTGTVTYNPDWTGTVTPSDLCSRSLTGDIGALTCDMESTA